MSTVLLFIEVLIFGITSLVILRFVRSLDEELVGSIALTRGIFFGYDVDLGKYFNAYKIYHREKGWNLVLILNVVSYPAILITGLYLSFFKEI